MDCSLPGSSIHGIFQARVLEWGAIAFSTRWEMLVKLSCSYPVSKPHQEPSPSQDLGRGKGQMFYSILKYFTVLSELLLIPSYSKQQKLMCWGFTVRAQEKLRNKHMSC